MLNVYHLPLPTIAEIFTLSFRCKCGRCQPWLHHPAPMSTTLAVVFAGDASLLSSFPSDVDDDVNDRMLGSTPSRSADDRGRLGGVHRKKLTLVLLLMRIRRAILLCGEGWKRLKDEGHNDAHVHAHAMPAIFPKKCGCVKRE
mmetsp:Transcript_27424/g.58933  ORF Transcript_27424/g.58933 Transcript_27424/m.58933 type:complete len:143 (-) Transcript_27424:26-454(-)